MTVFLSGDIWVELRRISRLTDARSFVAVAYLGSGASRRLPLRKGSILVVDASTAAVKSGQTDPSEIEKFRRRGVRVFSFPNLHAKVFVIGSTAFVGSTNVSQNSEKVYVEAAIKTKVESLIDEARRFVQNLATDEIGPERLKSLKAIYKKPRAGRLPGQRSKRDLGPRFFVVRLTLGEDPDGDEETIETGSRIAKASMTSEKTHRLMYFWNSQKVNRYRQGDSVLPVMTDNKGKILYVEPPSVFLYSNRGKKKRYYHFEQIRRSDQSPSEFRKRMPSRLKDCIDRAGKRTPEDAQVIRQAFNRPRRRS